jgi:hypothetical protein
LEKEKMEISYNPHSKEWLLWKPNQGVISRHKTRKEAEDALKALEKAE